MLNTLIKLGEQLSVNMSKWDDFLEKRESHIYKDDKKRDKKLYILKIIFDVDNKKIKFPDNLEGFSKTKSIKEHWLLQTIGANAGKTYVAVLLENLEHLKMSLIEKIDKEGNILDGDLINDINKNYTEIKRTKFYYALDSLKSFKGNADLIEKETILKATGIKKNTEAIVFCFTSIINSEIGINDETELSKLEGFEKYMNLKFFGKKTKNNQVQGKLCYASGEIKEDVEVSSYLQRGLLNAMFVQETKNYANNFEKQNFFKNYQISKEYNNYIERAAFYLKNNSTTYIADINHLIIPQFLSKTDINFEDILSNVKNKSDFLFRYNEIKKIETNITDEIDDTPYWINYLAIETDGNFFKTSDLIKDISRPYFIKILNTFNEINVEFKNYLNSNSYYNFYSVYQYIPVKIDMKNNAALLLFKDIFEHRPIEKNNLFKHFTKYLICQRSGQFDNSKKHRAYANVREQSNFDYAISNAINIYLAFLEVLKKLNLLKYNKMEENNELLQPVEEVTNDYGKRIESFFIKMGYTESQKALFYLGRVLSQVAYAQSKKNHQTKPVLNKINYNGMDKDAIIRLRLDLTEKARQYGIVNNVEFNFSKFTSLFNPNDITKFLSPEENVFYILSGYSFGMTNQENKNTEENN